MFGLGPATKIYLAVGAVDMRKGFDGLYGLVRDRLGHDPLSGHIFRLENKKQAKIAAHYTGATLVPMVKPTHLGDSNNPP